MITSTFNLFNPIVTIAGINKVDKKKPIEDANVVQAKQAFEQNQKIRAFENLIQTAQEGKSPSKEDIKTLAELSYVKYPENKLEEFKRRLASLSIKLAEAQKQLESALANGLNPPADIMAKIASLTIQMGLYKDVLTAQPKDPAPVTPEQRTKAQIFESILNAVEKGEEPPEEAVKKLAELSNVKYPEAK